MIKPLTELWIEHSQATFPKGYGGVDVNGVCVTSVDTYASGCISTYMKQAGSNFDLKKYQILQKCKSELEMILKGIDDEAYVYFIRLHEMCCLILSEANIATVINERDH